MPTISYYNSVRDTSSQDVRDLETLLYEIGNGKFQDEVLKIRAAKQSGKDYKELKKKLPGFTVSGTFEKRFDNHLKKHSGYIAIDIDNIEDVNEYDKFFIELKRDPYTAALFRSVSGAGLCIIIKIKNTEKHRDLFRGYTDYLFGTYNIIADPSGVNPSRLRFVSYDEDIYVNLTGCKEWTKSPKERVLPEKHKRDRLHVQSDFDDLVDRIEMDHRDITGSYHEWLRIGFGLHQHFGARGFDYFDRLSRFSSLYDTEAVSKQWRAICKSDKGHGCTIATVYYYAKLAGYQVYSRKTIETAVFASSAKKSGRDKATVIAQLKDKIDIDKEYSEPIIEQIYNSDDINVPVPESEIDGILLLVNQMYNIKFNELIQRVEIDNKPLDDRKFNTLYLAIKSELPKSNKDLIRDVINSERITSYHPFFEWLDKWKDHHPVGQIDKLFGSIVHGMPNIDGQDWAIYFGKRWLVGLINNIMHAYADSERYDPCLYMLVLSGVGNTGKSRFFRDMLPPELSRYLFDGQLNSGNESDMLEPLTSNLIIFDDELAGKSKKEDTQLKMIVSKHRIKVRLPYGHYRIDLPRIAVFAGATNENEFITDPTGNRRIIPIPVKSILFDQLNSVDRNLLLKEAYDLFTQGMSWEMPQVVKTQFDIHTAAFNSHSDELALFNEVFEIPYDSNGEWYTLPQIIYQINLRFPNIRISSRKLSLALSQLKIENEMKTINNISARRRYLRLRSFEVWKPANVQL